MRARIGGFAQKRAGRAAAIANGTPYDPRETTKAGTAAFLQKFADEIDPDHLLPDTERQRLAEAARREHMAKLALASSRARSARKARSVKQVDESPKAETG